ncbi:MAG: hypothetical protein EU532_12280 [Promethearchaeota archaeon]|nr:MAG: hypothetical protein EU532_12280 [Candidatus Lokiarchaeota archaeon]
MKRMKKKAKEKKEAEEQNKNTESKKVNKLEIMQVIDNLKSQQQSSIVEGENEKAMQYANQIIEHAIRYNMSYYIKEQEDFLKNLAKKEQIKFFTSEIEKECLVLNEEYDQLLESNEIERAHEKVENFKTKYADNPIFDTLHFINALVDKDRKIWIQYLSTPK